MTAETKHKPCPFCGSEDDGTTIKCIIHPSNYKMKAVWCSSCGMLGPIAYSDESAAWEAWDKRAEVKDGEETRS